MKRTIKSYSNTNEEIKEIALQCMRCRNYFFGKYSGIQSLKIIYDQRKSIRDVLVSNNFEFMDLPSRYWKCCLEQTISNIKSNWSNLNNLLYKIIKNYKLKELEKEYLLDILKNNF